MDFAGLLPLFRASGCRGPSQSCGITPAFQNNKAGFVDCNGKFTPLPDKAGIQSDQNPSPAPDLVVEMSPAVAKSNETYVVWRNDFERRTYESQLIQTRVIFVVVLVLVFAGLGFSWLQFRHAFYLNQAMKATEGTDTNPEKDSPREEVTFGKEGVVIRSAYLGVIILGISMAFFFLYLKYVYPIT